MGNASALLSKWHTLIDLKRQWVFNLFGEIYRLLYYAHAVAL